MPKLTWIGDKALFEAVSQLIEKAVEAKKNAGKEFGKNVIDPFSALFEISGFEIDYKTWLQSETARQAQKSLQNHVGDFHQNILGSCKGWENMKTGSVIDLVSVKKKIIAEVKNKHNTISGGKLSDLYNSMDKLVMPKASKYKGFTAYYVNVIPKKPQRIDKEFTPSDKESGSKCPSNKLIRQIDGASFYALATGQKNALKQLFDILPSTIAEITGRSQIDMIQLKKFFESAYAK